MAETIDPILWFRRLAMSAEWFCQAGFAPQAPPSSYLWFGANDVNFSLRDFNCGILLAASRSLMDRYENRVAHSAR